VNGSKRIGLEHPTRRHSRPRVRTIKRSIGQWDQSFFGTIFGSTFGAAFGISTFIGSTVAGADSTTIVPVPQVSQAEAKTATSWLQFSQTGAGAAAATGSAFFLWQSLASKRRTGPTLFAAGAAAAVLPVQPVQLLKPVQPVQLLKPVQLVIGT